MYQKSDDGVSQRKRTSPKTNDSTKHRHNQNYKQLHSKSYNLILPKCERHNHYIKGNRGRGFCYIWIINQIQSLRFRKKPCLLMLGLWTVILICVLSDRSASSRQSNGTFRNHPIVIGCHFSSVDGSIIKMKHLPIHDEDRYPSKRQVDWTVQEEEMEKSLRNSIKYNRARAQELEDERCKLPYSWQSDSYPTCNLIHENDMTSFFNDGKERVEERLLLHDHGFFRDIWVFKTGIDRNATVLKTLRHAHDLTERNFNRHRRDALVMERLTSSDHVAKIYSFCGNSVFADYATKGTVSDIIWPLSGENCTLTSFERLKLALKVAQAVSAAHMYDSNGTATIAHTDITPSQFLVFDDGSVKINDFNRCRFLLHDKNGKVCSYKVSHNPGKFRSPEEYSYLEQNEMVDIYAMGNIFYSIFSEKWPFEEINDVNIAQEKIKNGERPEMPSFQNDKVLLALAEIIQLCWKQKALDRPSAKEVVSLIEKKIRLLSQ